MILFSSSLAQNCEKDIGKFFSTIADLEKDFKIYSIVGENGSKILHLIK